MILSMLANHPNLDVLYDPLLDDSEHACKSSKSGCFVWSTFGWFEHAYKSSKFDNHYKFHLFWIVHQKTVEASLIPRPSRCPVLRTLKLWFKLEAFFEVCNVSCTQQVCNWDKQNMVEVTQMFLQWYNLFKTSQWYFSITPTCMQPRQPYINWLKQPKLFYSVHLSLTTSQLYLTCPQLHYSSSFQPLWSALP